MKAYQLNFRLGEKVFADDARAATAAILDGFQPGLVNQLMNYRDTAEGRQPANSFAPVHFSGLRDGFSLIGFGDLGQQIIRDVYPAIARGWTEKRQRPVTLDDREVEVGIESRPYVLSYTIPRIVLQKKPHHLAALKNPESGPAFIEKLLLRSLKTQADFLGLSLPENLKVTFKDCEKTFATPLGHGNAHLLGMKMLRFEANACLKGLWSFGYISSKGYGLLNADMARGGLINVEIQ